MPVNTQLPLSVSSVDTVTPFRQAEQDGLSNVQATENILRSHYDNMDQREKSRLQSTVVGAVQLKTYLDAGDTEGATEFLKRRKQALNARMAHGENLDTQETDYALQALASGNIDQLKNDVAGIITAGHVYGIADPSASGVGGATGELYDRAKKENPNLTLEEFLTGLKGGYGQGGKNEADISSGRAANYETTTGKNESDLQYKPRTAAAEGYQGATGKGAGDQVIANNNTLGSLDNLSYSIAQAKELLPKVASTGPVFGRIAAAAEDPDYQNLHGTINSITLQAKDLYNLGSGQGFTDADRDFLREIVAGKYARAETIGNGLQRFEEALQHRAEFLRNQNTNYQEQYGVQGAGNPIAGQTPPQTQPQKVTVSNGTETFTIDPNDLQAAMQEGFKQVQ